MIESTDLDNNDSRNVEYYIKMFARRLRVSSGIHPDDFIFKFILGHPKIPTTRESVQYYFEDGKNSADQFLGLLREHRARMPADVLEFAAGYGCVSRHLVHATAINLWTCDIHPQAVEFLRDQFFARALLSTRVPEDLTLPIMYDVVFALSFFSHMPIDTWERWLKRLAAFTRIGGLVIFTTHGIKSLEHIGPIAVSDSGFGFRADSEQKDLATQEYGLTVTTADFVRKAIENIKTLQLLEFREGFWWGHQDLYVLRKIASWWPRGAHRTSTTSEREPRRDRRRECN